MFADTLAGRPASKATLTEILDVEAPDGRMPMVVCRPDGEGPFPTVLVLMDPFGVNPLMREVARRLAAEGYVAAVPDLYYRREERVIPYDNPDRAADLVMRTIALGDAPEERVKDERVFADIRAALTVLEAHPNVDPDHIGALGFCMGARLAFLVACRLSDTLRAVVCFYAFSVLSILPEARQLRAPLLMLFGGRDREVPLTHVDRIQAELGYLGKSHEVKVYPGAQHGFLIEEFPGYREDVAREAWGLTLTWLGKYLR